MAKGVQVLRMLRPDGGWVISGDDYEGIQFIDCEPFTKAEFDAALKKVDAWQAEQDAKKAETKAALLDRLGITEDEAKLLLS